MGDLSGNQHYHSINQDKVAVSHGRFYRPDQSLACLGFRDISACSALHSLLDEVLIRMGGQYYNRQFRQLRVYFPRRFDAIHDRHGYVHDDNVRFQSLRFVNRFGSIMRFAANLELRMGIQKSPYRLSDDRMIVRHENSQGSPVGQRCGARTQRQGHRKS